MDWTPLTEVELWHKLIAAEGRMAPPVFRLWEAIKTPPEKWSEATYGAVGGGFWVVAIIGRRAIWYNDIEEGFNFSLYDVPGKLAEYFCNQDELEHVVQNVLTLIDTGLDIVPRCGPSILGTFRPE